jgi:hypothetical protein
MLTMPAYAAKRQHQGEIIGDAMWPPLIELDTLRRGAGDEHLTARGLRQRFAKAAGYAGDPDVRRLLTEKARVVLYDDGSSGLG